MKKPCKSCLEKEAKVFALSASADDFLTLVRDHGRLSSGQMAEKYGEAAYQGYDFVRKAATRFERTAERLVGLKAGAFEWSRLDQEKNFPEAAARHYRSVGSGKVKYGAKK